MLFQTKMSFFVFKGCYTLDKQCWQLNGFSFWFLFSCIFRSAGFTNLHHSVAPSVTTNVQYQTIWRDIKESTLLIKHSAAPIATKNVPQQKIQEWKHLVGSTCCGLSGQWDFINKRKWCLLSCFFRPKCRSLCLKVATHLTSNIGSWMVFHSGSNFHVSSDQQDSQIWSRIKSSRMVFHFGPDFHVSSDQQDSQI